MAFRVHSVEQDLANRWYARVCISDHESVFFKFEDFPTMESIQEIALEFVRNRELETPEV
jgi:hypothetical protein